MVKLTRFRKSKKNTTRKAKVATKKVAKPIKKYVKKAINAAVETKMVTKLGSASLYAYTGTSWSSTNRLCMTPMNNGSAGVVIATGDAQDQRTGNYIKTHKVNFKGVIYPNPYSATINPTPRPQEIVFWFISFRPQPAITVNPVDATFFQEGGSSAPPSGALIDVIRSINTERFYVYGKKVLKLGYQQFSGTGGQPNSGNFSNNDFKMNVKFNFNITKMCPKRIIFNDAVNNDPTSRALWCVWEAVNSDGTAQAAAVIPAEMQYQIDFHYKDA